MTAVGVIGLGAMGRRIATRLQDRGHVVHVWSRSGSGTASLTAAGARPAASPAQVAARSEVVIVMVSDGPALKAVTQGPEGVLAADRCPAVLQMSTVGPSDLADLRAALPAGSDLLDAPVLGSLAEAESGTLRLLVGADDQAFARWANLLRDLGTPQLVGPPGAGTAAKLVANSALFGVIGVLGETLELAQVLGLSQEAAFDVLAATPLAAQAERRRAAITTGEFPPRFALSLARKDADLIAAAATAGGSELRLAAAMRAWLLDAEKAGLGADDYTAVLAHLVTRLRPAEQDPEDT